jgi:hypothetical protein
MPNTEKSLSLFSSQPRPDLWPGHIEEGPRFDSHSKPVSAHPSRAMDRSIHRVAGPYRVTFSQQAWRLIGTMPAATFQSLQQVLDRIAEAPHRVATGGQSRLSASLDGLTVVFELDDAARTLTVVDVVETGPRQAP